MTLGENLQRLRRAKGLSQDEVAQKLFLSRQSVSKWENDGAEPGVENLKALSRLYGVTIDELVGNTPDEPQDQEKGSTPEEFYQGILILRFLTAVFALLAIRENTLFLNWDLAALAVGCRWRNRQVWIVTLALEAASLLVYLIFAVRVFWYYGAGSEFLTVLVVSGNVLAFVLSLQNKTKIYFCGRKRAGE